MENLLLLDTSSFPFLHGDKENYAETIENHIDMLLSKFNTDKYIMFMENSKSNFRIQLSVSHVYKGHREKNKSTSIDYLPYLLDVFEYIRNNLKPVTYYGIENDDSLCIMANYYRENKLFNPIICANDGDYLAVEGTYYSLKTNTYTETTFPGEMYFNEKGKFFSTGLYNTYSKILKGAAKENYKGLKGYGPVKVYELLKGLTTEAEMRKLCFDRFVLEHGYREGSKKFEEGFRLCYLLRENVNFELPNIQMRKPKEVVINNNPRILTIELDV